MSLTRLTGRPMRPAAPLPPNDLAMHSGTRQTDTNQYDYTPDTDCSLPAQCGEYSVVTHTYVVKYDRPFAVSASASPRAVSSFGTMVS